MYDGDQVIAEYSGSDNLPCKFVYGPGIDEPLMMIDCADQSEVIYYDHADRLGSMVAFKCKWRYSRAVKLQGTRQAA
jgi:hypothetical protein